MTVRSCVMFLVLLLLFTSTVTYGQILSDASTPPGGPDGDRYLACNTTSQGIPDAYPSGVVSEAYFSHDVLAGEVQVYVEIAHSWIGDLTVDITSPEGTSVRLHNRTGSGADEIAGWYDEELPVDGPGSLVDFYGEAALGTWTLEVVDHAAGDIGNLVLWCIDVHPTEPGGISGTATLEGEIDYSGVSVTAEPGGHSTATDIAGAYSIDGIAAGIYLLQFSKYGWETVYSETVLVAEGAVTSGVDAILPAVYQFCDAPATAIPDADTLGIDLTLEFPHDVMIGSLEAYVDVSHPWIGDLTIDLTSPEGTTVRLHNRTGSGSDDIVGWYDSELPVDGPGALLDYRGEIAAGTWTLTVADHSAGDAGVLDSWCLDVAPTVPGAISGTVVLEGETNHAGVTVTASPGGESAVTDSTGQYVVSGLLEGIYDVEFSKPSWSTVILDSVVVAEGETTGEIDAVLLPIYSECVSPMISIPDADPIGIASPLTFVHDEVIEDIEVYVDIDHSYPGDLTVDLTSPQGTTVRLHNRTGDGADDIIGWYDSELPVDGPGALADFRGESSAGTWTFTAADHAAGDAGFLNTWCVAVVPGNPGSIVGTVVLSEETDHSGVSVSVGPGNLSVLTDVSGNYELTGLLGGTYTVQFSKDGWTTVTKEEVTVNAGEITANVNATLLPVYLECSAPGLAIPDNDPAGIVDYFSFNRDVTIEDVEIYVDIDHSYIGDLTIDLTSPMGTTVRLHNQTGGGDDDILGWYDSELVVDGPGTLSDFDYQSSLGTWTLRVTDWASGDSGTLDEWCVRLNDDAPSDVEDDSGEVPRDYVLRGAFPNPFNPATNIVYGLPAPADMSLSVYDVAGRLVRGLYHGRRDSGYHRELWDGRDDVGHPLGSGVYFLRLSVDGVVRTSKALLLK